MLRYITLFCLSSLLFSFCKKEDANQIVDPPDPPVVEEPPIIAMGKASALRNDKFEEVPFKAKYVNFNSFKAVYFYASRYNIGGSVEERFGIGDVPPKIGKYPFTYDLLSTDGTPHGGMNWIVDGDQQVGSQLIDTTRQDHLIEIVRYDSVKNIIEGRFQVFFKNYKKSPILIGVPDTISFTQGKFNLYISN